MNFKALALSALVGLTAIAPMAAKADLRGDYSNFQDAGANHKTWCKAQFDKVTHTIETKMDTQLFVENGMVKVYSHGHKGHCSVRNFSQAPVGVEHTVKEWGTTYNVAWFMENGEIVKYRKDPSTGHMNRQVFKLATQYNKDHFIWFRGGF